MNNTRNQIAKVQNALATWDNEGGACAAVVRARSRELPTPPARLAPDGVGRRRIGPDLPAEVLWHELRSGEGMNTLPMSDSKTQLRSRLTDEHASLKRLFQEVIEAFRANARVEAGRLWTTFDRQLRTHMASEERYLLPAFQLVDPSEAAALRRQHDALRGRLLELSVGVDLHITSDNQVEAFVDELEAHAQREDALAYRFAEQNLSEGNARHLRESASALYATEP